MEDDVVSCVATGNAVWVWGLGEVARAFGDIVGPSAETVGIVGVEAVGHGEAENGGADEAVVVGNSSTNGWRGFVTVWGCAGDVGWVGGRGVVPLDAGLHRRFGLHFRFG